MKTAVITMDAARLKTELDAFFAHPHVITARGEARSMIRDVEELMFDVHYDLLSSVEDVSVVRKNLVRSLRVAFGIDAYCRTISDILVSQLQLACETDLQQGSRPIRLAAAYIAQHFHEPIRLQDTADAAGLSLAYFSTLFHEKTGERFSDYLNRFRILKAKELLADMSLKVVAVSLQCGFQDPRYFARLFKELEGMTPTQYRRLLTNASSLRD